MVDEWTGSGGTGTPGDVPDMDSLFKTAVNDEDVKQTQADALKPAGSYVTVPVLTYEGKRQKVGERTHLPSGLEDRLVFRFFGGAQLTVTEKQAPILKLPAGTVVKASFGFTMSPERGNKIKDGVPTNEPDGDSSRWADAYRAYEVAYKTKPRSWGDIVRYVQNYPVILRVIQMGVPTANNPEPDMEPRNHVMRIFPVREGTV